ncbi:MAG: chemotaxis protein CheW [Bacteriovoracaceae bacterium]
MQKQGDSKQKYMIIMLGGLEYGVPLFEVKEVISLPPVVPVPGSPDYLIGMINLRGKVVSIVDLCLKVKIKKHDGPAKNKVVIITEIEGLHLGCLVDGVKEIISIKESDIEKNVDVKIAGSKDFCLGMAKFEDRALILLLDLRRATDLSELVKYKEAA